MNTAIASDGGRQRVIDHLASNFAIQAEAVQVVALGHPSDLPSGATEFSVERRGAHGQDVYSYVALGNGLYCSHVPGDFARLVREQSLFERVDVSAQQAMRLYALLELPDELKTIDAGTLERHAQEYGAYPQVQPPALSRHAGGGATLTFFATPLYEVRPEKWTVAISPGRDVTLAREPVGRR